MEESTSLREKVLRLALEEYDVSPDYPFGGSPEAAVLRHRDTKKWFGLIMSVRRDRLGLSGKDAVDVLNVKSDPRLVGTMRGAPGVLPAYHMNKESWLSVLLDGTADWDTVRMLLDTSFELTKRKSKPKPEALRETRWLIPANPKYYDIEHALWESADGTFMWKQYKSARVGDEVYLYVAAPFSAIRYRCRVTETDIPYSYDDGKVKMDKLMRLRLLARYDKKPIDRSMLERHGVVTVRGPRGMPRGLIAEIELEYGKNSSTP